MASGSRSLRSKGSWNPFWLKWKRRGSRRLSKNPRKPRAATWRSFNCRGMEVSLRSKAQSKGGCAAQVQSDLLPAYALYHLNERDLIREKIEACLTRGKARDFYDLYFILRSRLAFGPVLGGDKTIKARLVNAISQQRLDLKSELKRFLPVSQHILLKNFNKTILAEIEKKLP